MTKKNKLLIIGTPIIVASTLFTTISCSSNLSFEDIIKLSPNINLNDEGKKITANMFAKEFEKYKQNSSYKNPFLKYSNFDEVQLDLLEKGIDFKIDNDSVEMLNEETIIKYEATYEKNGKVIKTSNYLVGFELMSSSLEQIFLDVEKELKIQSKNHKAVLNNKKSTSEDVWLKWVEFKYDQYVFEENIDNFNIYLSNVIQSTLNKFNINKLYDIEISIENDFASIEDAKKIVNWNENSPSNAIKGKELNIKFKILLRNKDNKYEKTRTTDWITFLGFFSLEEKFNYLKESFVKQHQIRVKSNLKETPSSRFLYDSYHKASNDDKFKVLQEFLNIKSVEEQKREQQSNIIYEITNVEMSTNEREIKLICTLSWNGMKESNVSIFVQGFKSNDSYFQELIDNLNNLQLKPTKIGSTLSSKEVFDYVNKQTGDSNKYNELSKYISPLPDSNASVNYSINSISWNEADQNEINRGRELFIDIKIQYQGQEATIQKIVYDFLSPKMKYQQYFDSLISNIKLDLTSNAKKTLIALEINENNWKEHIVGSPKEDEQFSILDLQFDYSNGDQGFLGVSFIYKWKYEGYIFTAGINQTLGTMMSYDKKAELNYSKLDLDMSSTSYWDNVIKKGEYKNEWFTSYFGFDLLQNPYNSKEMIEGLSRLWKLPNDYFGIKFEVIEITYSNTNSSLNNTTLKMTTRITNERNKTYTKTFTHKISGFRDPFSSNAYTVANYSNNKFIGDRTTNYESVVQDLKMGEGTWQTTHGVEGVSWGYHEPYSFYVKRKESKWVNFASGKILAPFTRMYGDSSKYSISIESVQFYWDGIKNNRYGQAAWAPIQFKAVFKTNGQDAKGNSSFGKYTSLRTNYLILTLHFKNWFFN